MAKKRSSGGYGNATHNRPHSPKSHLVPAELPTPDPTMPDSMMCLTDSKYNHGGLMTGGIKQTGDPKATP